MKNEKEKEVYREVLGEPKLDKKELEKENESNSNSSLTTDSKSIYNLINERYK